MMPWVRAALMSWTAPDRAGAPQQPAERVGDDLHVHPVLLVLPGVVGPVGGDPVDEQQGAGEDHERLTHGGAGGCGEVGGVDGQDLHGLGDVAVNGGDADAEPGCELGVGVSAAQVREYEQGPPVRGESAPPCPALDAPGGQQAGEEPQGRAGQIDSRWVDKHVKLRADRLILVDNPSTRSFTHFSTPCLH